MWGLFNFLAFVFPIFPLPKISVLLAIIRQAGWQAGKLAKNDGCNVVVQHLALLKFYNFTLNQRGQQTAIKT